MAKFGWGYAASAPLGGGATGPNPTDRGKSGTKRSQLCEGHGLPLAIAVDGANIHDTRLVAPTLDAIVIARPEPSEKAPQHLCLDKAYSGEPYTTLAEDEGYTVHVPDKANAKKNASVSRDGASHAAG